MILKMYVHLVLVLFLLQSTNIFCQNWVVQQIDSIGGVPCYETSITTDTFGNPHIVYSCGYLFKYAKYSNGRWVFQTLSNTYGAINTATKICLDSQNRPNIAYLRNYPNTTDRLQLKYTFWDDSSWHNEQIDSFNSRGWWSDGNIGLALNRNEVPYISYPYINPNDTIREIRCAYKSGDTWIIKTVYRLRWTLFTSKTRIAFDTSDFPIILFDVNPYHTDDTCRLFCARLNCDTWEIEQVINAWNEGYVAQSVKVDTINRIHLLYSFAIHLMYALKENNNWEFELVGVTGAGGYADLALYRCRPHIVSSSSLTLLSYGYKDTIWHYELIQPDYASLCPSIAIDRQGRKHVSYKRTSGDYICYARRIVPAIEEERLTPYATHNTLEVFPNPAKNYFSIRLPLSADRYTLRLFDVTGKIVKSEELKGKNDRISLRGISPGIYFLQLDNEPMVKKLIITK